MEIKKFKINNMEIEFVNESLSTRNGFKHVTNMFINGCKYGTNTCHYLNRTWERYRYQTVMRGCVCNIRDARVEDLKSIFKSENGYKNLTAKRAVEFKRYIADDEKLKLYDELLEAIGR